MTKTGWRTLMVLAILLLSASAMTVAQQQQPPAQRPSRPEKPKAAPTNWVWLVDDEKLQNKGITAAAVPEPAAEPARCGARPH